MVEKKGFTLIELLAVIVILALVALITIPLVLGVIDRVQIASYKESLRSVFGAADIYIASSEFSVFPEEGINVVDTKIQMKNKNFTSGKILKNEQGVLELDKVSNGKYCAGGTINNIVIVTGSCDALDITPPTITIASNLVTSSSITIVANAEDLESGINGYQFSKDNGNTWTTKQISNVYNFTGLTNDTNYTFKVRVYNNNGLSTISEELNVATVDIPMPTYSINPVGWTSSAVVTITYPEREDGYIYEYSLDNALTWETVEEPAITKEITFNENGNVIARILDGTNEVSGMSYSVTTIDDINPTVTFSMDGNSTYAKIRATLVTVSDLESGVNPSSLKYLWTTSTTTPSEASFTSTFTNGNAIITPEGVTGGYYLWILASDNTDNKIITRSNVFNLDNTAPVITITGPSSITITEGATYVDQGATASDNINGNITSNIEVTSTVNRDVPGTYTVTYNVNDSAGNAATPRVRTVIVQSLYVAYTSIEQTVITSVQNYVTTHSSKLPLNVGNTTEITLTELRSNGYIGVIKDPVNPSIDCNGYILITKLGNNDYDYTPHMKCGNQNTISNTTQDGLIAHYKFDDFQEPTENILPNPTEDIYFKPEGSWYAYFEANVTITQNISVPEWGTNKATRIQTSGGTSTLKYLTQGIRQAPEGVSYTASIKIKNIGSKPVDFATQYGGIERVMPGEIKAISITRVGNGSTNFQMRFQTASVNDSLDFIVYEPQIEKKGHSTPFTPENRGGNIKDYSKNSNHSSLTLVNTPKWLEDDYLGSGSYEFNGVNNYINTDQQFSFNKADSFSTSFWIYAEDHSHKETAAAGLVGKGHWYDNTWDIFLLNNNRIRFECSGNATRNGITTVDTPALELQQWHHYVATYDNGLMKIYLNGVLIGSKTYSGMGDFNGNRNLLIGSRYGDLSRSFSGKLDDIRIYHRALNAEEIYIMYKKQIDI